MPMPRTDQPAKGFEILVIDDEPEIRELLAEHLRARGYRVATASDGFAAISLDSAITAVRLGAYDYLTKPFSLGQIDVVMARVTGSRSRKSIARPCVG
jgi:DNA-binding response OmpR family regulator